MKTEELTVGFTATYIHDHAGFEHIAEIPQAVAVTWVQQVLPDTKMGNGFTASQITVGAKCDSDATWNGWLNKLFVVVDVSHGRAIALYNHDGEFHIYRHSGN
jgi:hypothetical protein